ncbi:21549_t:CDS:1, partial [Gigaspora margarita]
INPKRRTYPPLVANGFELSHIRFKYFRLLCKAIKNMAPPREANASPNLMESAIEYFENKKRDYDQ